MVKTGAKKENNGEKNEKSQSSQILDGFIKEEDKMKMCNGMINKLIGWLIITAGFACWSLFAIFLQKNIDELLIVLVIYQLLIILFYYYKNKKTQRKKKQEGARKREEEKREGGGRKEEEGRRREDEEERRIDEEGRRGEEGRRKEGERREKEERRRDGLGRREEEGGRRNEEGGGREEEEEEDGEEGWGDRLLPSLEMATIVITTLMVRLRGVFALKSLGLLVIPYFLIYVIFWSLLFGNRY